MVARRTFHRRFTFGKERSCRQPFCRVELLESRTLLSFSTVDVVPTGENTAGVAADRVGNVYVAGDDQNGYYLRQGSNGGKTWANILTFPYSPTGTGTVIYGVGASPAGDVYVALDNSVLERPAGATQFSQVFNNAGVFPGPLSVDAAGNVYFVAQSAQGGAVWRQQAGTGTFSVVDTFPNVANAICATTQGVYEVGVQTVSVSRRSNASHWIVRKSLTGAPNSWSTVDDFQFDAADSISALSEARAVTVDTSGTVLVGGVGYKDVRVSGKYTNVQYALVRRSSNGGATWTTDVVDSNTQLNGIGTDAAGNEYIAGTKGLGGPGGSNASIVSMKPVGGTGWSVVDQLGVLGTGANGDGFTVDSNNNLYVVGVATDPVLRSAYGFVRSMPGAPAASPAAPALTPFSATPIAYSPAQAAQVFAPAQSPAAFDSSWGDDDSNKKDIGW